MTPWYPARAHHSKFAAFLMRSHSYINSIKEILQHYNGSIPLTSWLKQFFKAGKKYGSTDRKQIGHACYCYYRLGHAFANQPVDERILTAIFLCSSSENIILNELKPEWNQSVKLPVADKLNDLNANSEAHQIFPFLSELSEEINKLDFNLSFLVQPDLFLRIRPGKKEKVVAQLTESGTDFRILTNNALQLNNQAKADEILHFDADVVVQDLQSQRVLEPFQKFITNDHPLQVWDCCAASGGKSILFYDHYPQTELSVSDIRESILINLQNRFKRAGIKNYHSFIADISSENYLPKKNFDLVICDAPCSGSGTWSRTPEQLCFFEKNKIETYASLQKRISLNAVKALKKNGYFLYITCSVFIKENEEVVEFLKNNTSLQLKAMQYLKGYDQKADTLFTALFSL